MINIIPENARAAATPVTRSAITARASTTPVPPAMPWTSRPAIITPIVGASAITMDASRPNTMPPMSNRRRPKASEIGPISNCPEAMPTM